MEVFEGFASDPEIRLQGSSGGVISALAIFCIERKGMSGALHITQDTNNPINNRTVFSKDRESILSGSGSRYSPASPCSGLTDIENSDRECVFIGKPCDVTALRKAHELRSQLKDKTGIAISFFCAGTPSTKGLTDLLAHHGFNTNGIKDIRFRGNGWPGPFNVTRADETSTPFKLSYEEAWGFLQKYRPFRCHLCPDGMGEFADISCGDAWHRDRFNDEAGTSLILARTERGKAILREASKAGYITIAPSDKEKLISAQVSLVQKKYHIWGRLISLKAFLIPAPILKDFNLFRYWLELPIKEKFRSVLGTAYRIVKRGYYRRLHFEKH